MKIHCLISLGTALLFLTCCSTSKMAQNAFSDDDVYRSNIKAKQYEPVSETKNDSLYAGNNAGNNRSYDTGYALRADRFYYDSPYRNYYEPYYYDYYLNRNYNPYWGFGYGLSDFYSNVFYNPYRYWLYYGGSFGNTCSPYSYWYPYCSSGYYDAGYRSNIIIRNNVPRPMRGMENGIARGGAMYLNDSDLRPPETRNLNERNNTRNLGSSSIDELRNGRPSRGGEILGRPDYNQNNPMPGKIPSKPAAPAYSPPPPRSNSDGNDRSTGGNEGGRPVRSGRG